MVEMYEGAEVQFVINVLARTSHLRCLSQDVLARTSCPDSNVLARTLHPVSDFLARTFVSYCTSAPSSVKQDAVISSDSLCLLAMLTQKRAYLLTHSSIGELVCQSLQMKCLQIWYTHWEQEVPE